MPEAARLARFSRKLGVRTPAKCRSATGRPPLKRDPGVLGDPTGLWAAWRVTDVIKRGVRWNTTRAHAAGVELPTAGRPRPGAE
jgi:hypothetical protein